MDEFISFFWWDSHANQFVKEEELKQELSLLHVNIRTIQKSWDQLCAYGNGRQRREDVIVLTEVNLDATQKTIYSLAGFSHYAWCRENRKEKGWSCL